MSSEALPEVYLTIPDSPWPVTDDTPIGTGRVGDFTVERQIVAANMPGQVRGRSGFSIGTATVSIRQSSDRPLAPWAANDRRITTGQECTLYARDEATGEQQGLGAWRVQTPAGSLTRADVGVELIESQYEGRQAVARLPVVAGPVDPVWIVDQLARQAGFFSTPRPTTSTILSAPLAGSLSADVGSLAVGSGASWSRATSVPGLASATVLPSWNLVDGVGEFQRLLVTANVAGAVVFRLDVGGDTVDVEVTNAAIRARTNGGAWTASRTYTGGLNPNWPTRVQLVIEPSGSNLNVRARSSATGALSTAATVTPTSGLAPASRLSVLSISAGGGVSGIDVTRTATTSPVEPWAAPTAVMSLLDGNVDAPWIPDGGDVWTALQRTCDSFAAAGWVSNEGVLTVRNRHEMAGSNRPKMPVNVGERVEDLAWTLDADDYADRLTVTYRPVTWMSDADPFEQTAGEKLHVPARSTVSIRVDLGSYVSRIAGFAYVSEATATDSEWDANTAADGSGSAVSSGVSVTGVQTSPSSATVTVNNTTAADVWMVDFSGNPAIILRGIGVASQETEETITYGVPEIDAKQPLVIDLGKLVQRRSDVESLAGYLWERVNTPRYRLGQIRMPLDWSRDLGDILTLTHPESSLTANVLVVSDRKSGQAGSIEHRCDLILLPPTFSDFDAVWAGKTGDAFDAVWVGKTGTRYDDEPLRTEA